MQLDPGPWGEHVYDEVDERELADLPSGAARWVVIAIGSWAVMIAIGVAAYIR